MARKVTVCGIEVDLEEITSGIEMTPEDFDSLEKELGSREVKLKALTVIAEAITEKLGKQLTKDGLNMTFLLWPQGETETGVVMTNSDNDNESKMALCHVVIGMLRSDLEAGKKELAKRLFAMPNKVAEA